MQCKVHIQSNQTRRLESVFEHFSILLFQTRNFSCTKMFLLFPQTGFPPLQREQKGGSRGRGGGGGGGGTRQPSYLLVDCTRSTLYIYGVGGYLSPTTSLLRQNETTITGDIHLLQYIYRSNIILLPLPLLFVLYRSSIIHS